MHFTLVLFSFLVAALRAQAINDWSQPCFQGVCSYDLPASSTASGTLKIWGSPDAISDITAAAGWTILGCNEDALAQDIRLVCTSDDETATGCDHLYQTIGAVGKLVRLPENCGKSAFARVSRAWVDQDQSIPPEIARRLVRRDGSAPEVKGLALDTNFAAVDPSQTGDVSIAIEGSTVPGAEGNLTVTPPTVLQRRGRRFARRGLPSFVEDMFNKFNSFDKNVTKALPPLDIDDTFPIFESDISCPATAEFPAAFDASVKVDVATKAHAVVSLGVAASGTIIPPKLSEFGLFAGLDADLNGGLTLVGSASGTVDSGEITLFQVGIPGLDFPGILSIGPTFKLLGQAKATLEVDVDLQVDLSYHVEDAKLFFPPSQNYLSGGVFTPGDSPLKLSVSPSVSIEGTIEAHLIPRIDIGISGLGGVAEATVFLDLDASATATLTLNGSANAVAAVSPSTDNATETSASFNGCVGVDAGLDVNAGADASFFGIFDQSTQVNLFTKKFDLFDKCFGTATNKREIYERLPQLMHKRVGLICPSVNAGDPTLIAEEAIPASSIQASA